MIDVEANDRLMEVLSAFDRLERHPESYQSALAAPPEDVVRCLADGLLVKAGTWTVPVLTDKGKARLRQWRTCWDCHQECIEHIHHCPARRPATPYRSV